jgi:hypothetical protein
MPRPLEVRVLAAYRIEPRYDDGAAGEVDFSDLAARGVFAAWNDRSFFESPRIGPGGEIAWGSGEIARGPQIDLCPDAVYSRLRGKTVEELFPELRRA